MRAIAGVFFMICSFSADAQVPPEELYNALPVDSTIRYGQLSNGFTYFIKPVLDSSRGIKMRLIHKIGSNQEEDDQLDMAHAVEHMAFLESSSFPAGVSNSELLEEMDVENYKIRAFSGRNSTQYNFEIFNDSLRGLEVGLLWYRDIATGLYTHSQNVERVRGEVKQEFMGKVGTRLEEEFARTMMYRQIFPCAPKEVDYVQYYEKDFSQKALKRFYTKWYTPELLALSIVGDIDNPDELERLIKKTFADITPSEKPIKVKSCDSLYFSQGNQFSVVQRQKDPADFIVDNTAEIHFFFREPFLQQAKTASQLKRSIDFQIFREIVSNQFRQTAGEEELYSVMISDLSSGGLPPVIEIKYSFESGKGRSFIEKVSRILNQLKTHGISKKEFEKVKEKKIRHLQQYTQFSKRYWTEQIHRFYVKGEALPNYKARYLSNHIKQLTVDEFNQYMKTLLKKGPDDIGIIAPSGHDALSFKEEEVRGWIEDIYKEPVRPIETPKAVQLMGLEHVENLQKTDYIEKEEVESGAREFYFDNGVRVVLKKNSLKGLDPPVPILLHGFALGGAKSLPKEDYWSALNAPQIIRYSGVNDLNRVQISRILSNTGIIPGAVSPYIDYGEHGIYGRSNRADLEVMMQLVYLFFTRPNRNEDAFEDWKRQMAASYRNASGSLTTTDFLNTIRKITGDKTLKTSTFRKSTPGGTIGYKSLAKTDFNRAFDIYRGFFKDASGFTFIISGDFKEGEILPLAQKYLGNLPGSMIPKCEIKEVDRQELPQGPTFLKIANEGNYKMPNVIFGTTFINHVKGADSWEEQIKIKALGEVVRQKLLNLRFKKGYGVYDLATSTNFSYDLMRYEINTILACDIDQLQVLREEVKNIFSEIKKGFISSTELKSALGLMNYLTVSETAKRRGVFNHFLYRHYRFGGPWVEPAELEEYIEQISKSDIIEVAQKHFKEGNFHEFVMMDDNI